jgi:CRISPR system Cascade subunit CasB
VQSDDDQEEHEMTFDVPEPDGGDMPPPHVWEQRLRPARTRETGVDGAVLAALRRGIGREAGTVPEMWPYYRELSASGALTPRLRAEHLTLTLFAVHQQSRPTAVHKRDVGVGTAMAALRRSGAFSEEAVERRFAAFATATSLTEAGTHLRGLIAQLRSIEQGLDYTQLMDDLVALQFPASVGRVRRRWGLQFFISRTPDESGSTQQRTGE